MDVDEAFEGTLRRLRPAEPAIDRDSLLFRAGRATARRPLRAWQGAAALLTAALAVSLMFSLRPAPPPVERVIRVVVEKPVPTPTVAPDQTPAPAPPVVSPAAPGEAAVAVAEPRSGLLAYIKIRDAVLTFGIDALPQTAPAYVDDMDDVQDLRKSLYPWLHPGRPFLPRGRLPGEPT